MKNNLNKEIKEWLVKNYNWKSKEAIEGIKKEFGVELTPKQVYVLTEQLKIAKKRAIGDIVCRKAQGPGWRSDRLFIKTGQNKWVVNSRYVWEQHNGKIPKGMCIIHINGDRYDDRIENLALLTRPTFNYIIAHKLYFDDCETFKVACMMAMIAHIKPHYIRPSRKKGDVNARK